MTRSSCQHHNERQDTALGLTIRQEFLLDSRIVACLAWKVAEWNEQSIDEPRLDTISPLIAWVRGKVPANVTSNLPIPSISLFGLEWGATGRGKRQ
jgi:hypothetical protein